LPHPVPSVHASSISPGALPTATGCLPLVAGETGSDTFPVFGSTRTKKTLPCVSAVIRLKIELRQHPDQKDKTVAPNSKKISPRRLAVLSLSQVLVIHRISKTRPPQK